MDAIPIENLGEYTQRIVKEIQKGVYRLRTTDGILADMPKEVQVQVVVLFGHAAGVELESESLATRTPGAPGTKTSVRSGSQKEKRPVMTRTSTEAGQERNVRTGSTDEIGGQSSSESTRGGDTQVEELDYEEG